MGTDTDAQVIHGAFGNMLKQFVEEYVSKVLVDSSTKKCMLEVSPGNGATVQQCGAEIKTSTANGVYKTCQQPAKYDEDGKLASVSGKPPIHCGKHRKNKPPRRDKGKMRDVKNATTETTGSDDSNGDGGSKRTHGNETGADHGSVPKMPRVDSSLGKKHVDVLDPGSREVSYTMIETSGSPLIDPPVRALDEAEKARDIKESTVLQRKLDELQRKYDESEKENKRLKEKSIRVSEMDAADGLTRLDPGPKKVKKRDRSELKNLNDELSKKEKVIGSRRKRKRTTITSK
jgi:hypothetical protein